ncbi:hypothetical protein PT2222_70148 [Paraburkholderia tropica]
MGAPATTPLTRVWAPLDSTVRITRATSNVVTFQKVYAKFSEKVSEKVNTWEISWHREE